MIRSEPPGSHPNRGRTHLKVLRGILTARIGGQVISTTFAGSR